MHQEMRLASVAKILILNFSSHGPTAVQLIAEIPIRQLNCQWKPITSSYLDGSGTRVIEIHHEHAAADRILSAVSMSVVARWLTGLLVFQHSTLN